MFNVRIKSLRTSKKKTQQDIADLLGITRPAYTAYEQGNRTPDNETIQKLADYYGVSLDYLFGRTDIPNPIQDLAAHRSDDHMDDLPEEAKREIENFKAFIRSKYGKQKGDT